MNTQLQFNPTNLNLTLNKCYNQRYTLTIKNSSTAHNTQIYLQFKFYFQRFFIQELP